MHQQKAIVQAIMLAGCDETVCDVTCGEVVTSNVNRDVPLPPPLAPPLPASSPAPRAITIATTSTAPGVAPQGPCAVTAW